LTRRWRRACAALVLGTFLLQAANAQSPDEDQLARSALPNIVFIFTDDLGYGDIGAFGATDVATPHIDSLATNGAKFTQFYSASPVCSPSRAGLLTGRNPIRMGIHEAFFPSSYLGMPQSEITIPELLKPAGYTSTIIGKWHLGHHREYLPLQQGFDEYFGIAYSNDMTPLPLFRGNEVIAPDVDQSQLTKMLTSEATDFIDRSADQPFFLLLAHPMPHVPIYASSEFENVSERGPYGDVIEELDWSVVKCSRRLSGII
jgi:arylsulfatase A-like enzyme